MFRFIKERPFIALLALIYLFTAVYYCFINLGKPMTGTDDANILLEYSRNFSSGHGIVYNIGGERVEGYSCFLFFLIVSLISLFTASPEIPVFLVNLMLVFFSIMMIAHSLKIIYKKAQLPEYLIYISCWALLTFVLLNPFYISWSTVSLMDTALYSFMIILMFYFLVRSLYNTISSSSQPKLLSVIIVLLILTRPEGMLWSLLAIVMYSINQLHKIEWTLILRKMSMPLITWVSAIILITSFRLIYFGYPVPNTFYTKVSSSLITFTDGYEYLLGFIQDYSPFFLLPVMVLIVVMMFSKTVKQNDEHIKLFFTTTVIILTALLIPVLEGGDHFKGNRFFQNIYPLLIVPALFLPLFIRKNYWIAAIFPVVFLTGQFFFQNASWNAFIKNNYDQYEAKELRYCVRNEFYIATNGRTTGEQLTQMFRDEMPVIGYGSAGGIAYGYEGWVYDMMGLNNTKLAHADKVKSGPKGHQSFNKAVFYELSPDILVPITQTSSASCTRLYEYYTDPGSWDNVIFKGLFNDELFNQKYRFASVESSDVPGIVSCGYYSNGFLEKISGKEKYKVY